MKNTRKQRYAALLILTLVLAVILPAAAENAPASGTVTAQKETLRGASDSFVSFPVLASSDESQAAVIGRVNQAIRQKARIQEYSQLLSAITEGSQGLRMDYDLALPYGDVELGWPAARYASILFSAQGKMLSGRPSQIYYPMTFDLSTGEEVPFDRLFTDPEGARAFIEEYVMEEVAPTLSTYLENSDLLPVPFDRFFLDGMGRVIFLYENRQLSFLSGFSGAVAFRYSELWDYLDTSETGVPMQALYHPDQYPASPTAASLGEKNGEWAYNGALYGLGIDLYLGDSLEETLAKYRAAADSEFYPGGAYYEVEEAALRGTLILTDENEETVTGLLSSRVDHFGIETGKTTLADAVSLMGYQPLVQLPIDEIAAEMYRVCPGVAAAYSYTDMEQNKLTFTLFADSDGIVQYIGLDASKISNRR